jgi:serine/threonine protein kinase
MSKIDKRMGIESIINYRDLNVLSSDVLKLDKEIGSGGFGKVLKGTYYDMPIIVKVLHKINTRNYTNEIANVYKYRHPNIPKFLGVCEFKNSTGLVFEFIDGKTLSNILIEERDCRDEGLDPKVLFIQKLDYMIQLASIVEFLHDHRLIHRDLKPDNILIDKLGALKLLDYGIAIPESKGVIAVGSEDDVKTELYASPEMILQQCDEDEDVDIDLRITKINTFLRKSSSIASSKGFSLAKTVPVPMPSFEENQTLILVTNKYDVWCYSLILSELFTNTRSWTSNGNELELYNIHARILSGLPYPINPLLVADRYKDRLCDIIRMGTVIEPENRATIKQLKFKLIELYEEELRLMKNHTKMIRKPTKINFEELCQNSLIIGLKTIKMNKEIEKSIYKQRLMKIVDDISYLSQSTDNKPVDIATSFKNFYYMTYDNFTGDFVIYEFPKKETTYLKKREINNMLFQQSNKEYQSPYCLNHNNKLYIIGGLVIYKQSFDNEVFKNETSKYEDSNLCLCYNHIKKELKALPSLSVPRSNCSAIIFRNHLYVVGGKTNVCENLCLTDDSKGWICDSKLNTEMFSPLLINYNDTHIFAIQYDNQEQRGVLQVYDSVIKQWQISYFTIDCLHEVNEFIGVHYQYKQTKKSEIYIFCNYVKGQIQHEQTVLKSSGLVLTYQIIEEDGLFKLNNTKFLDVKFYETNMQMSMNQFEEKAIAMNNSNEFYMFDDNCYYFSPVESEKKVVMNFIDNEINEIV